MAKKLLPERRGRRSPRSCLPIGTAGWRGAGWNLLVLYSWIVMASDRADPFR